MESGDMPLVGGNMEPVLLRGDTVVRRASAWTPAVHRLLSRLADADIGGVPRPLAIDGDGTEVLTFVEGEVPIYPLPAWV